MLRVFIVAAGMLVSWSCRTLPVAGACPESVGLRCLTAPVCTFDRARGCMLCRCGEPEQLPSRRPEDGTRPLAPPADPMKP